MAVATLFGRTSIHVSWALRRWVLVVPTSFLGVFNLNLYLALPVGVVWRPVDVVWRYPLTPNGSSWYHAIDVDRKTKSLPDLRRKMPQSGHWGGQIRLCLLIVVGSTKPPNLYVLQPSPALPNSGTNRAPPLLHWSLASVSLGGRPRCRRPRGTPRSPPLAVASRPRRTKRYPPQRLRLDGTAASHAGGHSLWLEAEAGGTVLVSGSRPGQAVPLTCRILWCMSAIDSRCLKVSGPFNAKIVRAHLEHGHILVYDSRICFITSGTGKMCIRLYK